MPYFKIDKIPKPNDKDIIPEPMVYYSPEEFFDFNIWYELALDTIISKGYGPTYTARFLYLYFTILYAVVCFYAIPAPISITEPELNVGFANLGRITPTDTNFTLGKCMNKLFTDLSIPTDSITILNPPSNPNFEQTQNYIVIHDAVFNFLSIRDNDGWKNGNNTFDLPNDNITINYDGNTQDLSSLIPSTSYTIPTSNFSTTQNRVWTPIVLPNGTKQKYLTPYWGNLTEVFSTPKFSTYLDIAKNNFPTSSERNSEIEELITIQKNLTDQQRLISEYFEGGSGTVSPPGIMAIYAYYTGIALGFKTMDMCKLLYVISSGLFESSIVTWGVKKYFCQSRPIQDVRRDYISTDVRTQNGSIVQGKLWSPYQKSTFITPPFPDYTSGHSCFSASAMTILNYFTNGKQPSEIKFPTFSQKHLGYICPAMSNGNTPVDATVYHVGFNKKSSRILDTVPVYLQELYFNNWTDISNNAGMSRVYGGIHVGCSNTVGLILGEKIGKDILASKNLS